MFAFGLVLGLVLNGCYSIIASPSGRIYLGSPARDMDFPYQVRITISQPTKTGHCSGALISYRWVLTAAHCAVEFRYGSVMLYFGSIRNIYHEGVQKRRPIAVYIYKNYNSLTLEHDIALVKVIGIRFNEKIQPLYLPHQSRGDNMEGLIGQTAVISGWGGIRNGDLKTHNLRYTFLSIIPYDVCKKYFPIKGGLHGRELCAQDKFFSSPCVGDSGSPLVVSSSGLFVGILSAGLGHDCENGVPTVYTRVALYRRWIKNITGI